MGDKTKLMAYPLIHINCIIDEDLSMISYIFNNIHNEDVFDFDILDKYEDQNKFIYALYTRRYENPLEFILKDQSKKDFVGECYKELKESGEFLTNKVFFTDVYNMVDIFNQSDSIIPSIMYDNDYELNIIKNDPLLSTLEHYSVEELITNKDLLKSHGQLYFRYVTDAEMFVKSVGKSFYFSSSGINLTEDRTEPEFSEILYNLGRLRLNQVNFFELYSEEMIGRTIN